MQKLVVKHGEIRYLSAKGQAYLIENERSPKYKFLYSLLCDAGPRITEALTLKWSDLDFQKKTIQIRTLKQAKSKNKIQRVRIVPMTERIQELAGVYWKSLSYRPSPEDYVFPSQPDRTKPAARQPVDRKLKALIPGISAHVLRHTFGAKLASEEVPLETTARLLGHTGVTTTFQFYYHVPEIKLREAVKKTEPRTWFQDIKDYLFPKKRVHIQPMEAGRTNFHVGRKDELEKLAYLTEKRVNTLILGPQGMGKSHLLDNLKIEKLLRADEVSSPKKFLGGILLMLQHGDKEMAVSLITQNADIRKFVNAESVGNLIETVKSIVEPREYTLIVDDVTRLTPSGLRILEQLKNHFHIIAAARNVKLDKITGFSNFERIDLRPLNRNEVYEFLDMAAERLADRIEDETHFKEYIYRQTKGNPGYILEMIDRLDVETDLSIEKLTTIEHIAARQGVAIFPFVVIMLASMTALRYIGRGAGVEKNFLMMLAGIGLLVLFFGREMLRATKRKHL